MDLIYFDNAAATKPLQSVNKNIEYINREFYYNPSASHKAGTEAEKLLESSRNNIASFIGTKQSELIFTSGGTESINLALRGAYKARDRKRKRIISTRTEHSAAFETLIDLSKEGAEINFSNVDHNGIADIDSIMSALSDDTLMVSLTHVNNETGVINPVKNIASEIKAYDPGIIIHIDAVQSFGKFSLSNEFTMVDLFSCSAHKTHGPRGTGILYIKRGTRLAPILTGGGQERDLRPGTVNLASIYAFGELISYISSKQKDNFIKVTNVKNMFLKMMKESGFRYETPYTDNTSPYILNIVFPGIKGEILMHHLEEKNIIISAGAACSSKKKTNRVLEGYGLSKETAGSSVRISFSEFNTTQETEVLYKALCEILPKLSHI